MKVTKYTARHLFQTADPDWAVWVELGLHDTEKDAELIANSIHADLSFTDGSFIFIDHKNERQVLDANKVRIEKLKEQSRNKVIWENSDFEIQNLKISDIKTVPELMNGFYSIGYEVKLVEQ